MKINKFKKVGTNKYKIYFDNEILTVYEDVILKYNLLYKKEIDNDLLHEINKDNFKASIYDTAVKYISIRMRSVKELREYLTKKKFECKNIDEVIDRLLHENILNDSNFARCYVNDKLLLTNNGPDKIKCDLMKLGISDDIISNVISNIDNDIVNEKLEKIIKKEIKNNTKLPLNKMKNKIINRCINAGYKYDSIIEVLNSNTLRSKSNIEDEYNKLYSKYRLKYEDYKLKQFLRGKLYQKGYSIEEINSIID